MKTTNRKGLTVTRRDFINNVTSVGVVMGASSRFANSGYSRAAQPQQATGSRSASRAPLRILVIVAHADDMEYNIGGTVAKWVRRGPRGLPRGGHRQHQGLLRSWHDD